MVIEIRSRIFGLNHHRIDHIGFVPCCPCGAVYNCSFYIRYGVVCVYGHIVCIVETCHVYRWVVVNIALFCSVYDDFNLCVDCVELRNGILGGTDIISTFFFKCRNTLVIVDEIVSFIEYFSYSCSRVGCRVGAIGCNKYPHL